MPDRRPRRTIPFPAVMAAVVVVQLAIIAVFVVLVRDFPL